MQHAGGTPLEARAAVEPMKVVVVASGALDRSDASWLEGASLVLAADGGATSLDALGRRPDALIGDLDSVEPSLTGRLEGAGTRVERYPFDKEASDAELALEAAIAAGATEVVLLGALGGERLDHELANLLLLADPAFARSSLRIVRGDTQVRAVTAGASLVLAGAAGDLVTLLPIGGDTSGVTTAGLRWPLEAATLRMGRSRGLSNVVESPPASVHVGDGTLLVIETAQRGEHQ
jgi:thiamine pyrophosphokinase